MKKLILILLLISSFSYSQSSIDNSVADLILTSTDLKNSGVINISDVFNLINNWNTSTINGYSFAVAPNNLSLFQNQNLAILIDGQQIDLGDEEFINLNLIPLTIDQIDTVEVISLPQLYNGKYSNGGAINFKTKKPTNGLSLNLFNSVGNEVGDPGPYAFTQEKTPNVDKLGYLVSFNLNTRGENWYLRTFVKTEENYLTDADITDRINQVSNNDKSKIVSASAILNFNAINGNHNLLISYTDNDNFPFYSEIGHELGINKTLKHIGLNGTFDITKNIDLNYYLKKSENSYNNNSDLIKTDSSRSDDIVVSRLVGVYKSKKFVLKFGSSFEEKDIALQNSFYEIEDLSLFASVNYLFTPNFNYVIDFSTSKKNGETLFNATLNNNWEFLTNHSFNFIISYSENSFNNFYYSNDIYNDYYFTTNNYSNINNLIFSTLSYNYELADKFNFTLSGSYKHFNNYTLEDYNFQFSPIDKTIETNYNLVENQYLKVYSATLELENKISKVVSHKLYYSYQADFEGSNLFRELWQVFPNHKFAYSINFNFNNSFGIWAKYYYQSETLWSQYSYLDYQYPKELSSKIKAFSTIDLSIQKWLWQKRIWLNLVFKDILNNRQYYHPMGAGFDMRFYLQFHLYFHSILI